MRALVLAAAALLALPIVAASGDLAADDFHLLSPCSAVAASATLPFSACSLDVAGRIRVLSCLATSCHVVTTATVTMQAAVPGSVSLQFARDQAQVSTLCASNAVFLEPDDALVTTCSGTFDSFVDCGHDSILAAGQDDALGQVRGAAAATYGVCGHSADVLVRES